MALKTTDAETPPTALTAVAGISYAVFSQLWGSRVRVINLSWHVLETTPLLRPTIQFAGNPHLLELRPCVVVIAAGNYGSDNADIPPTLPASYGLLNTIVAAASQPRPEPPATGDQHAEHTVLAQRGLKIVGFAEHRHGAARHFSFPTHWTILPVAVHAVIAGPGPPPWTARCVDRPALACLQCKTDDS